MFSSIVFDSRLTSCTDLLKNKSRPEAAAADAAGWVISERDLRERLKKEREAREMKEKVEVCFRAILPLTLLTPF